MACDPTDFGRAYRCQNAKVSRKKTKRCQSLKGTRTRTRTRTCLLTRTQGREGQAGGRRHGPLSLCARSVGKTKLAFPTHMILHSPADRPATRKSEAFPRAISPPPPFFSLAAATGLPVHMHGCSFDMRTRGSPTHRTRGHFPRSTLCLSSCASQPAKAIHCSALLLAHVGSIVGPAAHTQMGIGRLTGTATHARKASKSKGVEPARRC